MSLFYLGAITVIGAAVFTQMYTFEGILVVEQGKTEKWVVAPSHTSQTFSTAHRNMPAEVIGFDNPQTALRVLGTEASFDAVPLPYRLHLTETELLEQPDDLHLLEVHAHGERREMAATPGSSFVVPEGTVGIDALTSWEGLVRDGRGTPMAVVTLQLTEASWTPALFLSAYETLRPIAGLALALHWYDDESQAREALTNAFSLPDAQRWGIVEEERVHWFEALQPGTGLTTAAGREYVLLEVIEENDQILGIVAGRQDTEGATRIPVQANSRSPEGDIRLEVYQDDLLIRLHAWRDGAAMAQQYAHNDDATTAPLLVEEGDTFDIAGHDEVLRIRLEQVMRNALPVTGAESPVRAMSLDTPLGAFRLREGQSRALTETRLRYRRRPQPPITRYTLQTLFADGSAPVTFVLNPGACRRIGNWRFCHDQTFTDAGAIAMLSARRVAFTPRNIIGALIFFVGAAGICFFRFANWHNTAGPHRNAPHNDREWTRVSTP